MTMIRCKLGGQGLELSVIRPGWHAHEPVLRSDREGESIATLHRAIDFGCSASKPMLVSKYSSWANLASSLLR